MKHFKNIDDYIGDYPSNVQVLLQKMRQTIRKAAPQAEETISYGIPTFKLNGNLVHFGGFKDHISFFPTGAGVEAFKKELSQYSNAKGTVRFTLDQPIPYNLITKIVKFRVKQNMEKKK